VEDGPWFADGDTGWLLSPKAGFAGGAMITDFLSFFMFYKSHGFLTIDVNCIRTYFKDFRRAYLHALAAASAFIRVQNEKPIS
jgi:hypothetical protein